jgi:glycine C-acetyltransferase/8-amino-7-oxononanoate synthase
MVDFSSNDYLGLSAHPALGAAAREALDRHGTGAGAARLMSGDLTVHHELEAAIAKFKGKEAALLVNSGYQANTGLVPALAGRHDAVFADRLCHASLVDGALLSRARLFRFEHNDMGDLQRLLNQRRDQFEKSLIVTESVFSMDGDLAPLRDLVELKNAHRCEMLVDEAHATGVFGPRGEGCVEAWGLTDEVEFVMGTFSKALGGFGAYVAGNRADIDYLINSLRSFIYSTALPPAVVASNLAAVKLCREGKTDGAELLRRSEQFRRDLRQTGFDVRGESQIIPVMMGTSEKALWVGRKLAERGLLAVPVRPPTVPRGASRIRISLCSAHSDSQLQALKETLCEMAGTSDDRQRC